MREPSRILIVKTSALGDIIQSFDVLRYLKQRFPHASIDWAVEAEIAPLIRAHPLVEAVAPIDFRGWRKNWFRWTSWKHLFAALLQLRKKKYDWVFDLQGNCKSALVTFFVRGTEKIGFGWRSVREKPNLLATSFHYEVPKTLGICSQYVRLVQQHCSDACEIQWGSGVLFRIDSDEARRIDRLLASVRSSFQIVVCPGSRWINKRLEPEALVEFLKRVQALLNASFFFVWGSDEEALLCHRLCEPFHERARVVERLSFPLLQNLMSRADLVVAVDSSALHLCSTTKTPSFSIFGPTSSEVFKPLGKHHFAYQGTCPYGRGFVKTCPVLRTCPTGACIRDLKGEELFRAFCGWYKSLDL